MVNRLFNQQTVCFLDDSTRLKLSYLEDDPCSDYINASYIPVRTHTHARTHTHTRTHTHSPLLCVCVCCRATTSAGSTSPPRARCPAPRTISGGWCGSTASTTSSWWHSAWRRDGWVTDGLILGRLWLFWFRLTLKSRGKHLNIYRPRGWIVVTDWRDIRLNWTIPAIICIM